MLIPHTPVIRNKRKYLKRPYLITFSPTTQIQVHLLKYSKLWFIPQTDINNKSIIKDHRYNGVETVSHTFKLEFGIRDAVLVVLVRDPYPILG